LLLSPLPANLRFDVLSIDVGSNPLSVSGGGDEWVTPVKPIDEFGKVWSDLLSRVTAPPPSPASTPPPFKVCVVGGGAGGVELALSIHHRLLSLHPNVEVTIVARGDIMGNHNKEVGKVFRRILKERGVNVKVRARLRAGGGGGYTVMYHQLPI